MCAIQSSCTTQKWHTNYLTLFVLIAPIAQVGGEKLKQYCHTKVRHKLPYTFCIDFVECLDSRRETNSISNTKLACSTKMVHKLPLTFRIVFVHCLSRRQNRNNMNNTKVEY